jgi:hypothetical protein
MRDGYPRRPRVLTAAIWPDCGCALGSGTSGPGPSQVTLRSPGLARHLWDCRSPREVPKETVEQDAGECTETP